MSEENPETLQRFSLVAPADYRYLVKELYPFLSENAFTRAKCKVEAALAKTLCKRGLISPDIAAEIESASDKVTTEEVYGDERKTGHDIISLVNMIRKRVSDEAKSAVHKAATSYDIVDTANAWRYKNALNSVIIPDMVNLEKTLIYVTRAGNDILQIGRTHLQHAEPITFGFAIAQYVSRFGNCIMDTRQAANNLRGKFSGAVGAYNASSLFVDDPEQLEKEVLMELGMMPAEVSTQIVPPEPMMDLMHNVTKSFTALANLADDLRNLQRPEIAEVGQPRETAGIDVSRSSTMPHKANPVGLENIKSMYKVVMPWMMTMYMDGISDHQRDLTNSASQRNVPQVLDLFDYSVKRMAGIMKNIKPHPGNMRRNFEMSAYQVMAEPIQLLLGGYGYPNAHEYIGKLADKSVETGVPLTTLVIEDSSLQPYLQKFTPSQLGMIKNPAIYLGKAPQKAADIANAWEGRLKQAGL